MSAEESVLDAVARWRDRYAVEVKASMPCYAVPHDWDYTRYVPKTCISPEPYRGAQGLALGWRWGQMTIINAPCPSCSARIALEQA